MNQPHLPRSLIILLFILVAVTFFVGTLRTFAPALAAPGLEDMSQKADLPSTNEIMLTSTLIANFPPPGPTWTPPPASLLPPPTVEETFMPTPAPTPTPILILEKGYADTTGIIAMGILLVVAILIGMAWGGRGLRVKKGSK
jgi:hypothetical protein